MSSLFSWLNWKILSVLGVATTVGLGIFFVIPRLNRSSLSTPGTRRQIQNKTNVPKKPTRRIKVDECKVNLEDIAAMDEQAFTRALNTMQNDPSIVNLRFAILASTMEQLARIPPQQAGRLLVEFRETIALAAKFNHELEPVLYFLMSQFAAMTQNNSVVSEAFLKGFEIILESKETAVLLMPTFFPKSKGSLSHSLLALPKPNNNETKFTTKDLHFLKTSSIKSSSGTFNSPLHPKSTCLLQ